MPTHPPEDLKKKTASGSTYCCERFAKLHDMMLGAYRKNNSGIMLQARCHTL